MKAAESDIVSARERIQSEIGGWYPKLNLSASYGKEHQKNAASEDTLFITGTVRGHQLLWDFGVTNSSCRPRNCSLNRRSPNSLLRARCVAPVAERACECSARSGSLKFRQTIGRKHQGAGGLENALVERGAGLSTDVLKQVTLAGAEARRVQSEGALEVARNTYKRCSPSSRRAPSNWKSCPSQISIPGNGRRPSNYRSKGSNLRASMIGSKVAEEAINAPGRPNSIRPLSSSEKRNTRRTRPEQPVSSAMPSGVNSPIRSISGLRR